MNYLVDRVQDILQEVGTTLLTMRAEGPVSGTWHATQLKFCQLSGNHCQIYKIDWGEFNQHHLDDLPFCYPGKSENYNSDLAKSWGFKDRDLGDSLIDIFEHDQKINF